MAALAESFTIDEHRIGVTASVGLAFSGSGPDIPQSLLRDADLAMDQVKQAGGARHQVVDRTARIALAQTDHIERDLRGALTGAEFDLVYQGIADARNGNLLGVEALLRWRHPQRGWLLPEVILPIAERSNLIVPLGAWVLKQACRDLVRWRAAYGGAIGHVAVNMSVRQVASPHFVAGVTQVLAETGVDPSGMILELTETMFLEDTPRVLAVLEDIRGLGINLCLDDFGAGYSCLIYLKRFPFSVVKIDRSFMADIASDPGTRTIVAAIIHLSHELNLSVVAEGIETQQQLEHVRALGADRVQGYFLSRPLSFDRFNELVLDPASATVIRLPVEAQTTRI
jgi:EAL domain-containing protein (putative c-di-GMP-specific phosphodiesterase class I)